MKRNLQWTTIAVACGLLFAAAFAANSSQSDKAAASERIPAPQYLNVRLDELFPHSR